MDIKENVCNITKIKLEVTKQNGASRKHLLFIWIMEVHIEFGRKVCIFFTRFPEWSKRTYEIHKRSHVVLYVLHLSLQDMLTCAFKYIN